MTRIARMIATLAAALGLLFVFTPTPALAAVPIGCTFHTWSVSSAPLQATVTVNCPAGTTASNYQIDDASLIGPATVHFYSGPDLQWTKIVTVPTAGDYLLSVTITFNDPYSGPLTGTSTCCRITVDDVAATPPPDPVITPAPATPRPVVTPRPATPRPVITPRPATPQPVITPADTPAPTDTPSAAPSDSPTPSASPSASDPPSSTPTVAPSESPSAAPVVVVASNSTDNGAAIAIVVALLVLAAFAALIGILLVDKRRKARKADPTTVDASTPAE